MCVAPFHASVITLALVVLLVGCKQKLYGDLDEHHANDMVVALAEHGIYAEREVFEGKYSLLVDGRQVPDALKALKTEGYPKRIFSSLGSVFNDDSYINTTLQEHARFTYAISEELAESITDIPGVSKARVHIMLPQASKITNKIKSKPTASVFVYADNLVNQGQTVSVIKEMITHAVDKMNYEDVAVAIFDTTKQSKNNKNKNILNTNDDTYINFNANDNNFFKSKHFFSSLNEFKTEIMAFLSFLSGIFFFRRVRNSKKKEDNHEYK